MNIDFCGYVWYNVGIGFLEFKISFFVTEGVSNMNELLIFATENTVLMNTALLIVVFFLLLFVALRALVSATRDSVWKESKYRIIKTFDRLIALALVIEASFSLIKCCISEDLLFALVALFLLLTAALNLMHSVPKKPIKARD